MYLPNAQSILTAGMALTGTLTKRRYSLSSALPQFAAFPVPRLTFFSIIASSVAKGKVLDFAVEKCIDSDGNQRCTKPFLVTKSTCYEIEWSTEGKLSHTTVEVRDAGSDELVYYRDTNGQWTPEKGEVSSLSDLGDVSFY